MAKTIFELAFELFNPVEQIQIKQKVNEWSRERPYGQRITRNLPKELFLPVDSMKSLLQLILDNSSISIEELESKYQKECYKHGLKGGEITPKKKPLTFGTAIEKNNFDFQIFNSFGTQLKNPKEREEFIENLLHSSMLQGTKYALYRDCRLKMNSVWSTWNDEDLSKSPFDFSNTSDAEEIRANLGLTAIGTSKDLLLFVYKIPTKIKPQKATIADAGLYQYFEPPVDESDGHGWTINRQERPMYAKKGYNIRSRPECIHDSVRIVDLRLPIEKRT